MKNSGAILKTIAVLAFCGMFAASTVGAQAATYQLDNGSISPAINASDTTEPRDNWFANEFTALAGANVITRVDFGVYTTTANSAASVVLYRVTDPGGDPALGATRVYTQGFTPLTGDGTNAFLQPINLTSPVTFNVGDRFLIAVFIPNVIAAPPNDVYPFVLDTSGVATGTYWDRSAPNTFNLDNLSQARPINQGFATNGFVPDPGHVIIRAWGGAPIADLYQTGINPAGTGLQPLGSADAHWTLATPYPTSASGQPVPLPSTLTFGPAFVNSPDGAWLADGPNSQWITPTNLSNPGGNYIYQTTFHIPSGYDPTTASITGWWSSDNEAIAVWLNDSPLAGFPLPGPASFNAMTSFTISNGVAGATFQPGLNKLSFQVRNRGGGGIDTNSTDTGIRVEFTRSVIQVAGCVSPACATNKTVQCGTAWSFDQPTSLCANANSIRVGTVTRVPDGSGGMLWTYPITFSNSTVVAGSSYFNINDFGPVKTGPLPTGWSFAVPGTSFTFSQPNVGPNSGFCIPDNGAALDAVFTFQTTANIANGTYNLVLDTPLTSTGGSANYSSLDQIQSGPGQGQPSPGHSVTTTPAGQGANVTVTILSTVTNGTCPQIITRTWQTTDTCGNSNTCSQTVTVVDTTPPVLTCATNKTVQGGTAWAFDPPAASDACSGTNVTIDVLGTVTNGSACSQHITRTWLATDLCGNSNTCSQTVTVVATTPLEVLSTYAACGDQRIVVAYNVPLDPVSAQTLTNYALSCAGVPTTITQAILTDDPRIVWLFTAQPLTSNPLNGGCCTLTINGVRDVCGRTLSQFATTVCCTNEPCTRGSAGAEYWLTFPGNYAPDPTNPPTPQLFITGTPGTLGTVSMPGLAVPFTANFTIPAGPAGGEVTITLPAVADLGNANNLIQTNGIHVVASQSVSVYGYNHIPFTTDAFLGLSTRSIGKSYFVLSYRNVFTGVPELNGSQFAIVATVDNTMVSIIPSNSVGWAPFSFTMMQGQTYQLRNTNSAPGDITGTSVVADQPIAVFGSHQCANIPDSNVFFADYLVEQLFPLELWGTNFVTVPLATRLKGDTFRFMAMLDGTTVSTNGVALPAALLHGQFNEVQLASSAQITSTKPIQVAQYADSSDFDFVEKSDPFMVLIPPTSLFATDYVVQTPTVDFTNDNFINIMALTNTAATGGIILDGSAISASRFSAIRSSGYSGAQVQVTNGPHKLYSTDGSAFGIIVYGWSEYDAYGYPGGICGSAQTETSQFTCPQTNPVVQVCCNGLALVPDLTTQVGNRSSARLITQRPAAGTQVGPGTTNIILTMVDQLGASQICTTPLTILSNTTPLRLAITQAHGTLTISWPGGAVLQRAAGVLGPWVNVQNVTSPYTVPISGPAAFFRVVQ